MKKWTDDRNLSSEEKAKKIKRYTQPKKRFKYNRISWDSYIRDEYDGYQTERSSFIPVTRINYQTYWLLGSFHDYPKEICMDFGGSCLLRQGKERNRQSPFGCAISELHEESKGLLTQNILKNIGILKKDSFHIYVGKDSLSKIKVFFFFIPFDYNETKNLINTFNTTPDVKEKLGPMDIYLEKDILNQKCLTTNYLTDFVNFLKK